jgi:hypothetical protein
MSEWRAGVFGELVFPAGSTERWKKRRANAGSFRDWSAHEALPDGATPVAALLQRIEHHATRGGSFVLETKKTTARLRAVFSGETDYWCQTLVLALREAAAVGATGTITIVDVTDPAPVPAGNVFRLVLDAEGSHYRTLRGAERKKIATSEETSRALAELRTMEMPAPTAARKALLERGERGAARDAAAATKRAKLDAPSAASALARRVRTVVKTVAAQRVASELLAKVRVEGEAAAREPLAAAWKALRGRAPRAGTRAAVLDAERKLRLDVGTALARALCASVDDASLGKRLRALASKDWPDERALVTALESALAHVDR